MNNFCKIYNALNSWGNNNPPNKQEIAAALKANKDIRELNSLLVDVYQYYQDAYAGEPICISIDEKIELIDFKLKKEINK